MTDIQKLKDSIDILMSALTTFKQSLPTDSNVSAQTINYVPPTAPEDYSDFESLKKALESNKWPEAVNPNLICQHAEESDKLERGKGIIDLMVEEDLSNLKFLDFGCGEGQCSLASTEHSTAISVGYDVKKFDTWDRYLHDKLLFTTDFDKVIEEGPYDVIIIFDVLDHAKVEDPTAILKKAKSVLAPEGAIYMRCHPFISRHGTHLYHELNKAFAHLVFTPSELEMLVPEPKWTEDSIGVTFPIKTYGEFITNAGLNILSRREVTERVESFFKIPKIAERIMRNTSMPSFPEFQMGIQFIDYKLGN